MKGKQKPKFLHFRYKTLKVRVLIDKVLIFRLMRDVQSRFWGMAGIGFMMIGFAICFAIRPDLLNISTALSDFGNDVRTSPYFAGSVFIAAYGMWRWRNYLARTWRHTMPVTGLITLTIVGLYIVALVPVSWNLQVHVFGVSLAGISMLLTVVADDLLTKYRKHKQRNRWRLIRFISFFSIVTGGWLTLASSPLLELYDVALLGEILMLLGYLLWVSAKTIHGEGNRSKLAKRLKKIVIIS